MQDSLGTLCVAAVSIGVVHTLVGPDHYLPFVAMSRAARWSMGKTLLVTALCGVGHVLGSVVIGVVGIGLGVALFQLEAVESFRGDAAGWLLLGFGLVYMMWGVRSAVRNRPHHHWHAHADGTVHAHDHEHTGAHAHAHTAPFDDRGDGKRPHGGGESVAVRAEAESGPGRSASSEVNREDGDLGFSCEPVGAPGGHGRSEVARRPRLTPWVLFTIFVFGPCEPLIPVLMFPAAQGSWWGVMLIAALFGLATIGTMLTVVALATVGVTSVRLRWMERYSHAAAGFVVACCGAAIKAGF